MVFGNCRPCSSLSLFRKLGVSNCSLAMASMQPFIGWASDLCDVRGMSGEALDAGAFFGSIMQRLQVRFYSISSSPLLHPKSIHITCAVVYEKTATGTLHPPSMLAACSVILLVS